MRLKNIVPRYKATLNSFSAFGDMLLIMDIQAATPFEVSEAMAIVQKSRMSEELKAQCIGFILKHVTKPI